MYAGKKLRQLRLKFDVNQTDMAESLGLSQSYYAAIETGKRKITKKMVENIKNKWGVDDAYFGNIESAEVGVNDGGVRGGLSEKEADFDKKSRLWPPKYYDYLEKSNADYFAIYKDVLDILNFDDVLRDFELSKLGNVVHFGLLRKSNYPSFDKFKEAGLQAIKETLPYSKLVHDFASEIRRFTVEFKKIMDDIEMPEPPF